MDYNYIDLHSHVLYGIDDGSKTIEESIEILKQYEEMGFKNIIATPHYIEETTYNSNNKQKKEIIKKLNQQIKKNKLNINIHIGNELYISNNILELLSKKEISTLNNSKYLLIELPMNNEISNLNNIVFELLSNDIIPIIAHPERYSYIQKDIKKIEKLVNQGVLLQINYGSIIGLYGKQAKKISKKMLKNNLVSLLGTDIHHPNNETYININKIRKKLVKIVCKQKAHELMLENPNKIINNSTI